MKRVARCAPILAAVALWFSVATALRAQITLTNTGHITTKGEDHGVAVAGNYAYVANARDGVRIYDVSNPAKPAAVGFASNSNNLGYASGIAVSGNYLYLANTHDGLYIFDVSNPASPTNIFWTNINNTDANPIGMTVTNGYAFVADYSGNLRTYNISNPTNMVFIGYPATFIDGFNSTTLPEFTAVASNTVYVAFHTDGLRIYSFGP